MQGSLLSSLSAPLLHLAPCVSVLSASHALSFRRLSSSLSSNLDQWQAKARKELKGKDPTEGAHFTQDVCARCVDRLRRADRTDRSVGCYSYTLHLCRAFG
jgi:hypothetical protein